MCQNSLLDDSWDYFLDLAVDRRELVATTLWSIYGVTIIDSCIMLAALPWIELRDQWADIQRSIKMLSKQFLSRPGLAIAHGTENPWLPPPVCVIKINTNFALPQEQDIVKLLVVLKDGNNSILGSCHKSQSSFYGPIGHAEIMALDFGLQNRKDFGCSDIIMETDCLQALHATESTEEYFLPIAAVVATC